MLIYVQHALLEPDDWQAMDARDWRNLPKKPVPKAGSTLDKHRGWIFDVCVQGVSVGYGADHVAVEPLTGNAVRVYRWSDDLEDEETDYAWADVWEFHPGRVDRTLEIPGGGSIRHQGPDQRRYMYAEDVVDMNRTAPYECGGLRVPVLPWDHFMVPSPDITRHGIWVRDEDTFRRYFEVRTPHTYEEWM